MNEIYNNRYISENIIAIKFCIKFFLFMNPKIAVIIAAIGMFAVAEWAERKFPREEY